MKQEDRNLLICIQLHLKNGFISFHSCEDNVTNIVGMN
jgi:hypothetical protein